MFNWKKFVYDVEVMTDATGKKVDYLCYHGIDIHQYGRGTKLIGAYKFSQECKEDQNLIRFFEANGAAICKIIQAMEYGLQEPLNEQSSDQVIQILSTESTEFGDDTVMWAAYEKCKNA